MKKFKNSVKSNNDFYLKIIKAKAKIDKILILV